MKKFLLSALVAAAAAVPAFAGVDNINYQAVIKNGNNVVANEKVELKFELLDKAEKVVYSETQMVTTNAAGYVSCLLGQDNDLTAIDWDNLTLSVSANLGSGYQVIATETVSSVPTALYAIHSADSAEIIQTVGDLMVDVESNKTSILGINASLVKYDGFIEDVETFNTDLVEKLEPMMGLNYEEINDFHERVNEALINLQDFQDDAEKSLQALNDAFREVTGINTDEINDFHQRVSETLSALNEKVDEMDTFNQSVSEELAKLQGLNYEEINDFHQRVSETLSALNEKVDEMDTFNQSVSEELAKLQGLNYEEINDFHQRVSETLTNLNEFKDDVEINLQDINNELAKLQGLNYEEESDFKNRLTEEIINLREQIEILQAEIDALKAGK